nr:zinc-type alcohol dehydrogenase-like protein [Quercus suber]
MRAILTSSSEEKLADMKRRFPFPSLTTVNYATTSDWHEEVLRMTDGVGVDLTIEVGGNRSLVKSIKCTRRGGIVSLSSTIVRPNGLTRGINVGSKSDMDDLCAAISATQLRLDDILDKTFDFGHADEALEYVWQGKQRWGITCRPWGRHAARAQAQCISSRALIFDKTSPMLNHCKAKQYIDKLARHVDNGSICKTAGMVAQAKQDERPR